MIRRRGILALPTLIVIEIVLAIGLASWALIDRSWGAAALAVAAVLSLGLIPLGGRVSSAHRFARQLTFRWNRRRRDPADLAPAPFDIPVVSTGSAAPNASTPRNTPDGDATIGARWVDQTLVTVLRVVPRDSELTFLTPGATEMGRTAGQLVPLDVLAECISPYDIRLASIEVISHGSRTWGTGVAATTYERTLGPLTATARRSVHVVLRLDPVDAADAVASRGGGAVGALRTATITTRRVARRLTGSGLDVRILSAAEITALGSDLMAGTWLDDAAESWTDVRVSGLRMRTAAIEPTSLPTALAQVWVNPAISTTVTIRLRHDDQGRLDLTGLVRFTEFEQAGRVVAALPRGLRPLDGRQFDGLAMSLPIGAPNGLERATASAVGSHADQLTDRLEIPASGCGQLIGADHSGRAVAIRLAGPGIAEVAIAADHHVVAQVVLRAVAVGVTVVVHTDRPDRWAHLVGTVADRTMLSLSTDRVPPGSGPRMVVADGVDVSMPPPGTTRVTVLGAGDSTMSVPDAQVRLVQNPRSPQDISVTTVFGRLPVTMVATPEEWALLGGYPQPTPTLAAASQPIASQPIGTQPIRR